MTFRKIRQSIEQLADSANHHKQARGLGRAVHAADFLESVDKPEAAARAMLAALEGLRAQLREHVKMDVRRHYSLMVADAAAGTAIVAAKAAGITTEG